MKKANITRYCAPPAVLRLLERDGLGWGHDLHCGTFTAPKPPPRGAK